MTPTRTFFAIAMVSVVLGCAHDDGAQHGRAERTSGDDHVATQGSDRDGTADTAVAEGSAPTAMDQGESPTDVETTRQIRLAVVGDSSLSFAARNCVIVTRGGEVTLRGDVTGAESAAIERHAMAIAGVTHVTNDLRVTDQASSR